MRELYLFALTGACLFPSIASACESNLRAYSSLSREDWTAIQQMMRSTRTSINKEAIQKWEIRSIIGSPSSCSERGRVEQCICVDREDCKKDIKASFHDGELLKIKKSVF